MLFVSIALYHLFVRIQLQIDEKKKSVFFLNLDNVVVMKNVNMFGIGCQISIYRHLSVREKKKKKKKERKPNKTKLKHLKMEVRKKVAE